FEVRDKQTLMPLGEHAAHWSSYIEEVIRGVPLYHLSWLKVPKEWKAALIADIGHLQKAYNTNKAAFKAHHWVIDPTTGTYNVKKIRRARPQDIMTDVWDKYIQFWNDPRNISRAAQNGQNLAKSTVISRQGSRSLACLRDEMEEMRRLETTGNYTDDEINRLVRGGNQGGHIPGIGRVLPARATTSPSKPAHESTLNSLHKKVDFMMSLFKSDSKYSDMFSQFESGGASGSGGCVDDEESADDQDDEDEDDDGDS
nr:F-box domain, leucine-rich repeat domain, L domain-like protein [Tanacetum cinerariifolium]